MKYLATHLNKEEFERFSAWAKKKGFVKPDGQVNGYAALKYFAIDPEKFDNTSGLTFSEPSQLIEAIEKQAEAIDKMTPAEAATALTKLLAKGKKEKSSVRSRGLHGPDTYAQLLGDFSEKMEDPLGVVFNTMGFLEEGMYAQRAQGRTVRDYMRVFDLIHQKSGSLERAMEFRAQHNTQARKKLQTLKTKKKLENMGVNMSYTSNAEDNPDNIVEDMKKTGFLDKNGLQ